MPVTINGNGVITGVNISGVDTGTIAFFAMQTAPEGYLVCDGRAILRSTYAALFKAIGIVFGAGDGSTTFNLPDLRANFVRAWDDGRGVDAGRAFGSFQDDAFESHGHNVTVNDPGHTHSSPYSYNAGSQDCPDLGPVNGDPKTWLHEAKTGITVSIDRAGGTETRPKNIALLGCIKV